MLLIIISNDLYSSFAVRNGNLVMYLIYSSQFSRLFQIDTNGIVLDNIGTFLVKVQSCLVSLSVDLCVPHHRRPYSQ